MGPRLNPSSPAAAAGTRNKSPWPVPPLSGTKSPAAGSQGGRRSPTALDHPGSGPKRFLPWRPHAPVHAGQPRGPYRPGSLPRIGAGHLRPNHRRQCQTPKERTTPKPCSAKGGSGRGKLSWRSHGIDRSRNSRSTGSDEPVIAMVRRAWIKGHRWSLFDIEDVFSIIAANQGDRRSCSASSWEHSFVVTDARHSNREGMRPNGLPLASSTFCFPVSP